MGTSFGRLSAQLGGLAATVLLALIAGCGDSTPAGEPTPTGSPAPSPTPSAPASTAADGTDLGACEDGTCEVRIDSSSSIELDGGLTVESLEVASIDDTTVALRLEGVPGGGISSGCVSTGGTCDISSTGESAEASLSPGSVLTVNELAIEVVAISDGAAILRLGPAG
jgi:hypothetical protein